MPGPTGSRPAGAMGGGPSSPDLGNMDDQALQSMMGQSKQSSGGNNSSGNGSQLAQSLMGGKGAKSAQGGMHPGQGKAAGHQQARPVGTIAEELFKYPALDILKGIKEIFSIQSLLGIDPQKDTPEEQAKKKQLHQRFNQLTQEQQAVAQKNYQEKMQKKHQQEQEEQMKKQQEAQKEAQSLQAPSSPKKGPVGPSGSKKQKATQQLQQNRQSLGKVQGAN